MQTQSRRSTLAAAAAAALFPWKALAKTKIASEFDLTDDIPLGELGNYDAQYYGPPESKAVRSAFHFPADAESASAYGIDISHHTELVPWSDLKAARCNYVYIKAGQSDRARDAKFESHWQAARDHDVPRGGYHWLTPGVSGKDQGAFFVRKLKAVGLQKGDLQPVIDLEWDYLGRNFKRTVLKTVKIGGKTVPIYKDYWADYSSNAILALASECVQAIKDGLAPLNIAPIVYTNRSWWMERMKPTARLNCILWPSDYRAQSYTDGAPRYIDGHDYGMWQFTEKGSVVIGGKTYGPFDCNKIIKGSLDRLLIA